MRCSRQFPEGIWIYVFGLEHGHGRHHEDRQWLKTCKLSQSSRELHREDGEGGPRYNLRCSEQTQRQLKEKWDSNCRAGDKLDKPAETERFGLRKKWLNF